MIEGFELINFEDDIEPHDATSAIEDFYELKQQILAIDLFYLKIDNTDCHYYYSDFRFEGF